LHQDSEERQAVSTKPENPPPITWESIDFEPTDFDVARAALEEPPAGVKALKKADPNFWIKQRKPAQAFDNRLTDAAHDWVSQLPQAARPLDLLRAYPRIVNKLAEVWPNGEQCLEMLDDLVVDHLAGLGVAVGALRHGSSSFR